MDQMQTNDDAASQEIQRLLNLAGLYSVSTQLPTAQGCESCGAADHAGDSCPHMAEETKFSDAGDIAGGIAGGALGAWLGGPPGAIAGGALGAAAGTAAGKWLDKKFDMEETDELAEEEQADFDYGHQDIEQDGEEIDPDTYIWKAPKLPQRIVKGTQGDNPLISEAYSTLCEKYEQFLNEDASRENEDGTLSPLSDPTKPEFDKDPLSGEDPVSDGSHSPMSTIARQSALK